MHELQSLGRFIKFVIASVCFLISSWAVAYDPLQENLPECPVVPGATWQWVGQKMVVNDLPMSVKIFEYAGTEEELVRFYTDYWRTSGHGTVKDNRFGETRVLSQQLGAYFSSVQFQSGGQKINGKIVVSLAPTETKHASKTSLPVPPGSTTASRVLSQDGALYSETLTLLVDRGVDFTWTYYQNQLVNAGWIKLKHDASEARISGHFQSERGVLQITIKPLPGNGRKRCQVLVHWMK